MGRRHQIHTAGLWGWSVVPFVLLASSMIHAENRPNIYGCGVIWGSWLGFPQATARDWDGRSMDKIKQMGGTSTSGNFAWIDAEPQRGQVDWSKFDPQVELAEARGLTIFAYSGLTPDWALPDYAPQNQPGIGYRFPPGDAYISDFQNFFRTLASRYCGRVRYYEFWNEPNGCSWINDGCANGNQASSYTPWLQRWYQAMKSGCSDVVLAVGGLDCNLGTGNGCADYITGIYSSGGGDSFDAVAIHPYGDTNDSSALHWNSIQAVYNVLVSHGHGHKKLWLNEYGWNTSDEAAKARLVGIVLTELEKPEYDMVFEAQYLCITDLPSTPDDGHDYGLCSRTKSSLTISPRESWNAFRDHPKRFQQPADGGEPDAGGADGADGAQTPDANEDSIGGEDASIPADNGGPDGMSGDTADELGESQENIEGSCSCQVGMTSSMFLCASLLLALRLFKRSSPRRELQKSPD